ncbi:protein kinase [Chengkuizengella sediminis]|uniref:protein kinase n=1 Tax=Chengkuizengella sediminis TaxID=1885917 RepID=UPI0013895740|nr:protein kinase [Chengkuizengella sediminis]NDI37261.1 protein kinase [Chengkuizengella sediminis]
MNNIQLLTGIYRLGSGCGLWSKEEIIKLCDMVIEANENIPYEIIEVSLMSKSKIDDIEGKLFELSHVIDEEYAVRSVLSVCNEKIKLDQIKIEDSIKCTTRLLVHTGLSLEKNYYDLYSMDDDYDLAKDGIRFNLTEVVDFYLEELDKYSKYFKEFKELYFKVIQKDWIR